MMFMVLVVMPLASKDKIGVGIAVGCIRGCGIQ